MERDYDIRVLRDLIMKSFSVGELRELCQNLGVEYEDFLGESRASRVGELLKHFERRAQLPDLEEELRRLRPKVPWDDAAKGGDAPESISQVVYVLPVVVVTMTRDQAEELHLRGNDCGGLLQIISAIESAIETGSISLSRRRDR